MEKIEHHYKTDGSDNYPRRMMALCSCGWRGPVLEGQGRREQVVAVMQWGRHIGWDIKLNPKPIPDHSHDWEYSHDSYDGENDMCGTAPNHWAAVRAIEEIENDR